LKEFKGTNADCVAAAPNLIKDSQATNSERIDGRVRSLWIRPLSSLITTPCAPTLEHFSNAFSGTFTD